MIVLIMNVDILYFIYLSFSRSLSLFSSQIETIAYHCDILVVLLNTMETYKLTNIPDSLYYIPNFITVEEEEHLLFCVNNVPRTRWVQLRNRRLQNWGGQPHAKGMIQTESLPKWLDPFTERILHLGNETIFTDRAFQFNHCLVNEYASGQGIMPHTDGPIYYPIVTTISLQSPTVIEFYRPIDSEKNEVSWASDLGQEHWSIFSPFVALGDFVLCWSLCCSRSSRTTQFIHCQRCDVQSLHARHRRTWRRSDHSRDDMQLWSMQWPDQSAARTTIDSNDAYFFNDTTCREDFEVIHRTPTEMTPICEENMPRRFLFQMFILGRLIFNRSALQIVRPCSSRLLRSIALQQQTSTLRVVKNHLLLRSASTSSSLPSNPEKTDRVWTIPNILTFIRIGSSPVLGYLIVSHQYPAALTLFLLSGLTDLLDGWIARRYPSQASALGSFLDPFADKVLVGIVVISLAYVQLLPLWLLALILSRDVAIMCVAAYLRVKSVQPPRTLKKILDMKTATVQLYPTFVSKVRRAEIHLRESTIAALTLNEYKRDAWNK